VVRSIRWRPTMPSLRRADTPAAPEEPRPRRRQGRSSRHLSRKPVLTRRSMALPARSGECPCGARELPPMDDAHCRHPMEMPARPWPHRRGCGEHGRHPAIRARGWPLRHRRSVTSMMARRTASVAAPAVVARRAPPPQVWMSAGRSSVGGRDGRGGQEWQETSGTS
jgi:hypothetical protein